MAELPGPLTTTLARGLAARATQWCVEHLDLFDPFAGGQRTPDVFRSKALTELSLLCAYASGDYIDQRTLKHLRRFREFAREIWDDPRYHEKLMTDPGMFRLWGSMFIALCKCYPADSHLATYRPLLESVIAERYATILVQNRPSPENPLLISKNIRSLSCC
jgi:hypothetical protein